MFSVGGGHGVILRMRVDGDEGASFCDVFLAPTVGEPGGVK